LSRSFDIIADRIFGAALLQPAGERAKFVREESAGNPQLERRVMALLAASGTPDDKLFGAFDTARQSLWRDVLREDATAGEDLSGQCVDDWRLVRRLARGGLATVYLAHREDGNFHQTAAFKVLRRGLDTDDVVARFRAERQILSTLEHPSIARILDGGALEDGRPYLVLEFVDGLPITRYCDENGVKLRGRISLLMAVLEALHHAHKHLVVHRDIKPSNILVNAEGHVSLLDFGISKLLDPEALPGGGTLTRTGVALLTPGYGSPEQHAGQPVTTASDIYQVGLVAYELITGKRPFDDPRRRRDAEATLPSRALGNDKLQREVTGDLDAIVGMAMHEEPGRRYASALDMRDDLQRYLDHRPVVARPDTLGYRFGKLARRRPWLVPAITIGILAIAGYLATLTVYNRQLEFEKRRAQAAENFMVDLLRSPDPFTPADPELGSSITVLEALDLGVARLQSEDFADPALQVSLLDSIAGVYASLDQHREAIELGERALAIKRELYGDNARQVLDGLAMLAGQYQAIGDYGAAQRHRDEELALAMRLFPESHPRVGVAEAGAAALQEALGNWQESERLYALGIDKMRQAPAEHSRPLINALAALSGLLDEPDPPVAAALLAEARMLANEHYGADSLSMALIHVQAATAASNYRDFQTSTSEFRAALDIYESRLGRQHGATLTALNNLGVLHMRAGEPERAEQVFRELIEWSEQKYGHEHRSVAGQYQNLGTVVGRQGRFAEAVPLHRRAHEIFNATLPGHFISAYPLISLAYADLQVDDPVAAERAARQALEILESSDSQAYAIGVARCLIALALEAQGAGAEGERLMADARAVLASMPVDPVYRTACRL
jgi:eukaryotic-like serine/threonine-protein kinase